MRVVEGKIEYCSSSFSHGSEVEASSKGIVRALLLLPSAVLPAVEEGRLRMPFWVSAVAAVSFSSIVGGVGPGAWISPLELARSVIFIVWH